MKLTIEHLCAYSPYGLNYIDKDSGEITTMRTISTEVNLIDLGWGNAHELKEFKPILRPLSDLTKEIEHNGKRFVPYYWFGMRGINIESVKDERWHIVQRLISWHFDIHKLIDANLAIDINTLKS